MPTEVEDEIRLWMNDEAIARQCVELEHLNETFLNNNEQQVAFDNIMRSILSFKAANRDDVNEHVFHFISGPGGTGKSCLFKKLHAACRSHGILSASAFLLNNKTNSQEDAYTEVFNQRVTTSPAK